MSADNEDDPVDPDRARLESLVGLAGAAIEGMSTIIRPLVAARVRAVLERNAGIVDQSGPALDHLTKELLDVLMPSSGGDEGLLS